MSSLSEISTLSNLLTPMVSELGVGGVGGFVVGYALKKVAKMAAIALGLFFVALQYLAYKGFITIDYSAMREWALDLMGQSAEFQSIVPDLVANIPFGASFAVGFYLGLKKG